MDMSFGVPHNRDVPESFVTVPMVDLSPREAYALLTAAIAPRPIAFVSTVSANGVANLAPFSFFMAGGANPPSLMFSPVLNSDGSMKDSLQNVMDTKEFVVNTVHRPMASGMNETSAAFPSHVSEWEVSGFTPLASLQVKPARVAESLVQFECRLFQVVSHGAGPTSAQYVIGEVVVGHFSQELWDQDRRRIQDPRSIARMGGADYIDIALQEIFTLERPQS